MNEKISTLDLKKEIIEFRKKLDSLLETHSSNSDLVLDASRKLDMLILEYYNLTKEKQPFDKKKPMS